MDINKVIYNNQPLIDLTSDTVTPDTLAAGATAHDKSGAAIVGTAYKNTYYVKGTQTASTGAWTGNLPEVDALYEGLTIDYWLPFPGNGNATLNLTLKNGTTTGAINCYYSGTTRLATHIGANNIIRLVYQTVTISGISYTGWWKPKEYYVNDIAYAIRNGSPAYQANSAIYRYQLLFQVDDNKLTPLNNVNNSTATGKAMLTSVDFLPFGKIYYYNSTTNVAANGNMASSLYNRVHLDLRYSLNCGQTLTAHRDVYLKCARQANGKFRITADPCWTQTLPSTNDGYYYIRLGRTYSTYQMYLEEDHPIYYHDGTELRVYTNPQEAVTDKNITGNVEYTGKVTKNYEAGSLAIVNNQLLRITQNIASGGNITIGSNAEAVDLETVIAEKAEKILVAKLPFLSSASLYNNTADFHNAIPREKDITAYLTDGSLWSRINGTNGYSLFEDLYVGDYLTAGGQQYMIVDFDYYIRCGDGMDITRHHLVMMPTGNMSIPEGTVLYGSEDTLTLINTANYRKHTGDDTVTVSAQETAINKKWNATIDAPNTYSTAGGYKFSRMRQVIMKAADTIIVNAFGLAHIKPIPVQYPNPANAESSGLASNWAWYKDTDWASDLRRSICDLPNETQIYGQQVWGKGSAWNTGGYEVGIDKWQFALFKNNRNRANIRAAWWLRSVNSAAYACDVSNNGRAYADGTSYAYGVLPRFLLFG